MAIINELTNTDKPFWDLHGDALHACDLAARSRTRGEMLNHTARALKNARTMVGQAKGQRQLDAVAKLSTMTSYLVRRARVAS